MAHPGVAEAAVVGIEHLQWQERPLALVVLKNPQREKVTKEDIQRFISDKFAKWQLPDEILFVSSIPKTSVGKISKKDIREEHGDYYMRAH